MACYRPLAHELHPKFMTYHSHKLFWTLSFGSLGSWPIHLYQGILLCYLIVLEAVISLLHTPGCQTIHQTSIQCMWVPSVSFCPNCTWDTAWILNLFWTLIWYHSTHITTLILLPCKLHHRECGLQPLSLTVMLLVQACSLPLTIFQKTTLHHLEPLL